jgi:hypothetical protein
MPTFTPSRSTPGSICRRSAVWSTVEAVGSARIHEVPGATLLSSNTPMPPQGNTGGFTGSAGVAVTVAASGYRLLALNSASVTVSSVPVTFTPTTVAPAAPAAPAVPAAPPVDAPDAPELPLAPAVPPPPPSTPGVPGQGSTHSPSGGGFDLSELHPAATSVHSSSPARARFVVRWSRLMASLESTPPPGAGKTSRGSARGGPRPPRRSDPGR